MAENVAEGTPDSNNGSGRFLALLNMAMAMPGAKVDRELFLRKQLRPYCPKQQVQIAVDFNPAYAHIPLDRIDELADSVIKSHRWRAAAGSAAAGIPGGLAIVVTIPADTVWFVWHAIVVAQKLSYLYGWPELAQADETDVETQLRMAMLIGAMFGIGEANHALKFLAGQFAQEVGRRLPRQALTKTIYYPVIKEVCKWLGIRLTKETFGKSVSKLIPVVAGVLSGAITYASLPGMAHRLKNHLRELEYAKPAQPPDEDTNDE